LLHVYLLELGQQLPDPPHSCPGLQSAADGRHKKEYAPTPTAASIMAAKRKVLSRDFPLGAPPQPHDAPLFWSDPPQQLAAA
jgi:hypothetical protein